jgi:ubiquinone/menaquinone biosynthesis C-methylase UbiE
MWWGVGAADAADERDAWFGETFDWMADRYVAQTKRVSWGRYPRWMSRMAGLIAVRQPRRLVDLGAGPGYLLGRVAEKLPDCALVAVDLSERALSQLGDGVEHHVGSMVDWADKHPRSCDAVVLSFVLRDLARPEDGIAAAARALAPDGSLWVLETHTPVGLLGVPFNIYFHGVVPTWGRRRLAPDWPGPPDRAPYQWLSDSHRRWHRGESLDRWLADAGFTDIRRHTAPTDVVMMVSARRPITA